MNDFMEKYLSGLVARETGGAELEALRDSFLQDQPVVHIPNWPFLKTRPLEVIVNSYAAIICGQDGHIRQYSFQKEELLESVDIYRLLKRLETILEHRMPFFFGLMSYDLSGAGETTSFIAKDDFDLPDFCLLFPAEAVIISKQENSGLYLRSGQTPLDLPPLPRPATGSAQISMNINREEYLAKIEQIRQLIFEGEVYQINYTIDLSAALSDSGYSLFNRIYQLNPAPFSAYVRLPETEIISNSPERFLMADQRQALTEPIKGTIKRHPDPDEDKRLAEELLASPKDAAELNMIVDLLRNDLSRVCEPGSVIVSQSRRLESFSNVHHLISTVEGRLVPGADYTDLLAAAFPGGSISGCPKIAALKYIARLEARKRSFYTGCFFIRLPRQNQFDSSLLIRTAIMKNGRAHFQVGGGVVIDSEASAEYEECLAKAASFLKACGYEQTNFQ
jgi:para-aminobenzoate synthetase component 1